MIPPALTSRRDALLGAGAFSLALAASPAFASSAMAEPAPLGDIEGYLALRFAGPGRTGWWINRATVFAMVLGRRAISLFDVIGLGRDSFEVLPDGSYHLRFDECGWYCAPGTTEPLDTMTSPINGRKISPQHYRSPSDSFLRDGQLVMARPVPSGVEIESRRGRLMADADQVWVTDDHFVRSPRKVAAAVLATNPAAGWNVQTSLATYCARRSDLVAHRQGWVPATCAYQTLASWRPWLDADDSPGVMSWRMHGTKISSQAEIPEPLLGLVRAQHAALLQP
jgi:hypothetical protein